MFSSPSLTTSSASYYHRSLPHRLEKAILFARTRPAAQVRAQFKNMVALLEQAWRNPRLHPQALDLVAALYPWPKRWGFIWEWIGLLTEGVAVGREHGRVADEMRFAIQLAEIFFGIGNNEEALRLGQEALQLAEQESDILGMARSGFVVGQALFQIGRNEEADGLLEHLDGHLSMAANSAAKLGAQLLGAILHTRRLRRLGNLDVAYEMWEPLWVAVGEKNTAVEPDILALAHTSYAFIHFNATRIPDMVIHLQQAVAFYQQAGDEIASTSIQGELAYGYMLTGQLITAQKLLLHVLQQTEEHRLHQELATYTCYLSYVYAAQGKMELAHTYIQRGLQRHRHMNNERWIWLAQFSYAHYLTYLDQPEKCQDVLLACVDYYTATNQPHMVLFCDLFHCLLHWRRGEQAQGYALAQRSVATTNTTLFVKYRYLTLFAHRCLALFLPSEQAVPVLEQALALALELKLPLQEGACLLSLAGLVGSDKERQVALWEEGVQILTELGAEAWLSGCSLENPPFVFMSY